MRWSWRARTLAAPLLFLLLLTPVGAAQQDAQYYGVQLNTDRGAVGIDYLGSQVVNLTIEDKSLGSATGTVPASSSVLLRTEVVGQPRGWTASVGATQIFISPGETREVTLNIQAGATIEDPRVEVKVHALYRAPNGQERPTNISIMAVARPNPVIRMQMDGSPPELGPYERQQVPIQISNDDYYPEMVSFTVQDAPDDWVVIPPDSVRLEPGAQETVFATIRTPQNPWFQLYPSSETITMTARTMTNEGGSFTIPIPASVSGTYLPGWVVPHVLLLILGVATVGRRTVRKYRERKLLKGKPVFPGLPPEKEARYEALKIADPDQADEMEERLVALHQKRKEAWKEDYKERKRTERDQRKEARERHEMILDKKREREKRRREAERRKREQMEKKREQREKLLEAKRDLQAQREQARGEEEDELAKQLREQREKLEREGSEADADAAAKRERLRELKRRKEQLEEDDEGST